MARIVGIAVVAIVVLGFIWLMIGASSQNSLVESGDTPTGPNVQGQAPDQPVTGLPAATAPDE